MSWGKGRRGSCLEYLLIALIRTLVYSNSCCQKFMRNLAVASVMHSRMANNLVVVLTFVPRLSFVQWCGVVAHRIAEQNVSQSCDSLLSENKKCGKRLVDRYLVIIVDLSSLYMMCVNLSVVCCWCCFVYRCRSVIGPRLSRDVISTTWLNCQPDVCISIFSWINN